MFHYIPFYGIQIAFKNFRASLGIWGSPWTGMENFVRFLTYPDFWAIVRNTLVISLYSLALFPIEPIFALMINEIDNRFLKKTVQMITYAPHFVSTVVVASLVLLILDTSNGVVNNIVAALGGNRIPFMTTPRYFASVYVFSGLWSSLGWGTIIYLAALSSISPELVEAAKIDGASRLQILRHINLPGIIPVATILFILRTGNILSVGRDKILLMQNALNLPASRVISTYVYNVGLGSGQFSYSTAIGLFDNIVNIICIIIVNQIAKRVSETSLW
ncbi:MAG: ABC transporter permease subunit [Treponema sp.]|nr:ABC transporter permease subunit [Treponema sp.]